MAAPDDFKGMAQGLAESEPLVVIGKAIANGGQHVQDAWDIVKQHLTSLGTKAEDAAKSATDTVKAGAAAVSNAVMPKLKAEGETDDQYIKLPDGSYAKFPASMSDTDIQAALAKNGYGPKAQAAPFNPPRLADQSIPGFGGLSVNQVKDVGAGVLKGAAHTAIDAGQLVAPALRQIPGVRNFVATPEQFQQARDATDYSNMTQRVGGGLETAAELAVPVGKAAAAIPTTAKAGKLFDTVKAAAHDVPVSVAGPGAVAMRIKELAERGGRMPQAVTKFVRYISDPDRAPFTYDVARDFQSNFSQLSSADYKSMSGPIKGEVAHLAAEMYKSVAQAAASVGKGREYAQAMTQYARAKRLGDFFDAMKTGALKAAPYATGTAIGLGAERWVEGKIKEILGGE